MLFGVTSMMCFLNVHVLFLLVLLPFFSCPPVFFFLFFSFIIIMLLVCCLSSFSLYFFPFHFILLSLSPFFPAWFSFINMLFLLLFL